MTNGENHRLKIGETILERPELVPTDANPKDEELLHQVLAGDRPAFAEIVRRYQNPLHAKIFRWVRDPRVAEEMTQETFIKAFQMLSGFRGESKFSTWLFQIAINKCRDFWRSQKRNPASPQPIEAAIEVADASPGAESVFAAGQAAARVRRALGEIPEKYRETLLLRFMNDLNCAEIAAATGQSLSNVKMRLLRGLEKLRQQLTKEGLQ